MSITRAGSSPATHIDRMDLKAKDYDDQQKLASKYTFSQTELCVIGDRGTHNVIKLDG